MGEEHRDVPETGKLDRSMHQSMTPNIIKPTVHSTTNLDPVMRTRSEMQMTKLTMLAKHMKIEIWLLIIGN